MDRIGGRAWTSSDHFGLPFDIGCAWLHAADRNPYFPEAQTSGWTMHHHDMNIDHLYYGKRKASEAEETAMKFADSELAQLMEGWDGNDDRVSTLLARGHAARAAATFAGPMDFGADYDEMSVEDFRNAADLDPFVAYRREPDVARYQSWDTAFSRADSSDKSKGLVR